MYEAINDIDKTKCSNVTDFQQAFLLPQFEKRSDTISFVLHDIIYHAVIFWWNVNIWLLHFADNFKSFV